MGDADEVWLGPARGDISDPTHVIHGHAGPAVGGIIFGAIPGVVTELAGMRHGVKSPEMFAAADVKTPDVLFKSGNDDSFFEYGWACRGCSEITLNATGQQRVPILPECRDHLAIGGIQRIKVFAGAKQHAFAGRLAARPVNQTAKRWAALGFEAPQFLSVAGIEPNHEFARRRCDHGLAHDNRIALKIIAAVA